MNLSKVTDEELLAEQRRRWNKRRGPIKGYRAICSGDEYDYGSYADYMIGQYGRDKKTCKQLAEDCVKKSKHGGLVREIYKDTLKPGVIH